MKTVLLILVLIAFLSGMGVFGALVNDASERIIKVLVNVMLVALGILGILVIGVNLAN